MPVGAQYDFQLDGKGYMLQRGQFAGRAWQRTGQPDTPSRRSATDAKYGVVDDTLDHPEVWDDWSGGFGQAYRRAGENTYHWAENFDARFPRQLVHTQVPRLLSDSGIGAAYAINANHIGDGILAGYGDVETKKKGVRMVMILGRRYFTGVAPTGLANEGSAIMQPWGITDIAGTHYWGYQSALFGSYTYIPCITTTSWAAYQIADDGTASSLASVYASAFKTVGDRMWKVGGSDQERLNLLQSIANSAGVAVASAANWSATLNIGNGQFSIQAIEALNDQLFCGMPNGLFIGDSSGSFSNGLPTLENQVHLDNCRDLTTYEGAIIAPTIAGVFALRMDGFGAVVEEIGPPVAQRGPMQGYLRAVRAHGPWLYGGFYTGSQSYLMAGWRGATEKMQWHTLNRLPHTTKISRVHFDGIMVASSGVRVPNRLWMAGDPTIDTSGTSPVYWMPIPFNNGNPLSAPGPFSANYVGSARIDLGSVDWNAPSTPKVFRAVDIWAENLASSAQWTDVYYTIDGGARTKLGTVAKSPKDSLYFLSTVASYATGQSIALSLESFTASYGVTPIYRAVVLRGALRPQSIDEITAVVRIADNVPDRQGTRLRPGATMLGELRALATAATPTTLVDLAGATQQVVVLAPVGEQELYQTGEENPEIAATVKMAVVTFTGG